MHCRKHISLFLATLILLANLGLTLSVHYCHNEIASISFQLQNEDPCVLRDQDSCCAQVKLHTSCCSNKVIKVAEKPDTIVVETSQLNFEGWVIPILDSTFIVHSVNVHAAAAPLVFYCDAHAPPRYKLHCQFVFYA
jgi:hypothetical protein